MSCVVFEGLMAKGRSLRTWVARIVNTFLNAWPTATRLAWDFFLYNIKFFLRQATTLLTGPTPPC